MTDGLYFQKLISRGAKKCTTKYVRFYHFTLMHIHLPTTWPFFVRPRVVVFLSVTDGRTNVTTSKRCSVATGGGITVPYPCFSLLLFYTFPVTVASLFFWFPFELSHPASAMFLEIYSTSFNFILLSRLLHPAPFHRVSSLVNVGICV